MIGLGTTKPSSMLTLSGSTFPTITALTTTGSYLGLGSYASTNLLFDNDSVQAKSDATTSAPFYINSYGGNVNIGSTSVPSSVLEVNGTVKL